MSGYWPATDEASSPAPNFGAAPTGFADNFDAANAEAQLLNNSNSKFTMLADAYNDRIDEIQQKTGQQLENPVMSALMEDNSVNVLGVNPLYVADLATHKNLNTHLADFESKVDELRKQYPTLKTHDQMWQSLSQLAQANEADNQDVMDRGTFLGKVGGFIGNMAGTMVDPLNLMTLPLSAARSASILRFALQEAGIGAGIETAIQPGVQEFRSELGLDAGAKQGLENIAMAAGGRGIIGGTIKGAGEFAASKTGIMLGDRLRSTTAVIPDKLQNMFGKRLVNMFDREVPNPTPEQQAARDLYAHVSDVNEQSPLDVDAPGALTEHNLRMTEAGRALQEDRPVNMPAQPAAPIARDTLLAPRSDEGFMQSFDPRDINVDAKTFQFKEGGDSSGVTDRLQGVQQWDPVKAGMVIVYEDEGGKRFIADGHQRLGLAQRIMEADPAQRPMLYGPLLRAADGYTPEAVRVIAAMKNIAEGTGSAIDAAKVLRVDPDRLGELPRRSQLVRQASDLVNLTDDAFGFVTNEIVPANYAAIVGRLVKAEKLQLPIINLLAKLDPENAAQAEAIVRQALEAGTHSETQIDLFGEQSVTSSLYEQRAKVLDKSLKKLRQDRRVFQTLVDNAKALSDAGNVLATDTNAATAETSARAQQLIQTLANRKGALSDALTAAARRAADEGKYANATSDFVDAVRSAIERGDFHGLDAGEAGRAAEAGDENPPRHGPAAETPDEKTLKQFDDPHGQGAQEQTRALEADLRREVGKAPDAETPQPPIVKFRKEAAAIEASLPPPAESYTRLWRGNRPGEIGKATAFTNDAPGIALPFRDAYKGDLSYVDVPTVDLAKYENTGAVAQGAEFNLPEELASKAVKVERGQSSLLDQEIPVGQTVDERGNTVSQTRTVRDLLGEIEQDEKDVQALGSCGKP